MDIADLKIEYAGSPRDTIAGENHIFALLLTSS